MAGRLLVYGATGYTGELIAREARDRGLDIVVAGRDATAIEHLAAVLDCRGRSFEAVMAGAYLDDIDVVLNCAGPFVKTYEPIVEACLRTETHYLDITGEIPVFEAIAERDREAERAGCCLLPGVGFDVVPSDCLAARLKQHLPSATSLRLGFEADGTMSRGTVASMIEHFDAGGRIRVDGEIVSVPHGWRQRTIDFGRGPRTAITIPWGDVSTAYYSTGIDRIEVYTAVPDLTVPLVRLGRYSAPLVSAWPVKRWLQWLIRTVWWGPSERQRATGTCYVWGEVTDGEETVVDRLRTPETYALTVDAATTAAERVLADPPTGFETPSAAFGPDFVFELEGVERVSG